MTNAGKDKNMNYICACYYGCNQKVKKEGTLCANCKKLKHLTKEEGDRLYD